MFAGQTSSYVFQRNFHELMSFIGLHYKLQSEGKLRDALNREPLYEFLHELTRRLHNFVFAAVCFVQHTDNFVKEIHGDAAPIKAPYDVEYNRHFGSGIHGFTVTLRDFFAHNATPFVQSVFGGSDATITEEYTVELDATEFREFAKKREGKRSRNAALKYLAANEDGVNLMTYVSDYYEAIMWFYSWFDLQNEQWCKPAWDHALQLQSEIEACEVRHRLGI